MTAQEIAKGEYGCGRDKEYLQRISKCIEPESFGHEQCRKQRCQQRGEPKIQSKSQLPGNRGRRHSSSLCELEFFCHRNMRGPGEKAADRSEPESRSPPRERAGRTTESTRFPIFGHADSSGVGNLGSVPQPELALWYSAGLSFPGVFTGVSGALAKTEKCGPTWTYRGHARRRTL
jgi:hypothetical protein